LADVERSVAARLASQPRIVSLQPFSLGEIWDDFRRVAQSLDIASRGEDLIACLQQRMQAISAAARATGSRPRLALIEWIEPLMAAANWMPELVDMAGGEHLVWKTWEELAAGDPDVILVMPCGFDLERALSEMHWLEARTGWHDLRAVRNRRVYVADGNQYFNRPGPRLLESLQILAEILHPDAFPPAFEGAGWKVNSISGCVTQ
jgi:iron complex transport system substrate-binding protein